MLLSNVLKEAFNFYKNEFMMLLIITVPLLLLQNGLVSMIFADFAALLDQAEGNIETVQVSGGTIAISLAAFIVVSWTYAALTLYLRARSNGHSPSVAKVWQASIGYIPGLLLAGVFSFLFVLLAALPAMITQLPILLIFSFLVLGRLAFVNFFVIDGYTPLKAMSASFAFSKPVFWLTMAILSMLLPLNVLGSAILALFGGPLPDVAQVAYEALFGFLSLFINVALFRVYMLNRQPEAEA